MQNALLEASSSHDRCATARLHKPWLTVNTSCLWCAAVIIVFGGTGGLGQAFLKMVQEKGKAMIGSEIKLVCVGKEHDMCNKIEKEMKVHCMAKDASDMKQVRPGHVHCSLKRASRRPFQLRRNVRTIILTLICHYSGMNGKVVFSIPFLLDQEVILLRHSLLMDQVPVFLPMEPRLAPYGRPL